MKKVIHRKYCGNGVPDWAAHPKKENFPYPLEVVFTFCHKSLAVSHYLLSSWLKSLEVVFHFWQIVLYSLNLIFGWGCLHSFSPSKCRLYPHPHILPHKSCSILLFLPQTNCIICFFLAIKVILLHDATLLPNLFLHRLNTRWMRTTTQAGKTSWWLMIIDSILLV